MEIIRESNRSRSLPPWLKRKIPNLSECSRIETVIKSRGLHTICREGLCPNRAECYARDKVTFMILGSVCTRDCAFCSVRSGRPGPPDREEPEKIAEAVSELGLDHVVVTSVTRDDLEDGGSGIFAEVVRRIRDMPEPPVVEVLVPDFRGSREDIIRVVDAGPDIFSHNIEVVRALYGRVRKGADYERSLNVLSIAKEEGRGPMITKSAMMLGLGESEEEIFSTMKDLREARCDFLAIGQYLRPGLKQVPVSEYITPETFKSHERKGYQLGFRGVMAGPLVRSSYQEIDVDLFRDRHPPETGN